VIEAASPNPMLLPCGLAPYLAGLRRGLARDSDLEVARETAPIGLSGLAIESLKSTCT
jgi:hypothetical protein